MGSAFASPAGKKGFRVDGGRLGGKGRSAVGRIDDWNRWRAGCDRQGSMISRSPWKRSVSARGLD